MDRRRVKHFALTPPRAIAALMLFALSSATSAVADPAPLRGRWVFDSEGKPVPPREFERGLQTSGLVYWRGVLWSVGDQRSEFPGHLFRLDPRDGRLLGAPIGVGAADGEATPRLAEYRAIRNPDLEGITVHPSKADTLLGVTEDKRPWVVEIRVERREAKGGEPGGGAAGVEFAARLAGLTDIDLGDAEPYRGDSNYRVEGIAVSGRHVYLAYERRSDSLPRILRAPLDEATSGGTVRPLEVPIDFASLPPRKDKPRALLNVNGIEVVDTPDGELIIAIARDQERLLEIDPAKGVVRRSIDLHLRAPDGEPILWVSPEGIAADSESGKLWIINDPDSIRGNYRLLADETATGHFADLAPLLFELKKGDMPH